MASGPPGSVTLPVTCPAVASAAFLPLAVVAAATTMSVADWIVVWSFQYSAT